MTRAESTNTYAWACATNGALTAAQRRAIKFAILRSFLPLGKSFVSSLVHRRNPPSPLPAPPDSPLVSLATEAAAEQSPALVAHGYRTWLIGAALADHDRMTVDPELLFVGSLLHDSGMMTEVIGEDFTIRSAQTILDLCSRTEALDPSARMQLADAVIAHATPGLTADENVIGFYVQSGAMADLAGLRMWDLPCGYLRAAYGAHPAHDVHRVVPELVRREARAVPDGRFALLHVGMNCVVRLSPTRLYTTPVVPG